MESLPVNKKVEMLVHRFISTLQKRIELRKKRMKNDEDDSEGSSDNSLSSKGCPESYSPDAGSVRKDLGSEDRVNLHVAKPSSENQINLGEESMKNEACNIDSSSLELIEPELTMVGRSEAQADVSPSFDRTPGPSRTSPGEINRQLGPLITNQSVPGLKVVLVRPREISHRDHRIRQEDDEEIPEEEAVCKFCFNVLKEENMVVKTMCGCKKAFALEECASNWSRAKGNSNCDTCGQEVQKFPVTLLRGFNSSQRIDNQGKNRNRNKRKWKLFSR